MRLSKLKLEQKWSITASIELVRVVPFFDRVAAEYLITLCLDDYDSIISFLKIIIKRIHADAMNVQRK